MLSGKWGTDCRGVLGGWRGMARAMANNMVWRRLERIFLLYGFGVNDISFKYIHNKLRVLCTMPESECPLAEQNHLALLSHFVNIHAVQPRQNSVLMSYSRPSYQGHRKQCVSVTAHSAAAGTRCLPTRPSGPRQNAGQAARRSSSRRRRRHRRRRWPTGSPWRRAA
jgi:hypothetical protein